MTRPLRVGLDLRSGREAWLGGVYYLQNLVLALRTLPAAERPDVVALAPVDDAGVALAAFERLAPLVAFRAGDSSGTVKASASNRVRRVTTRGDPPYGLERAARAAEVDVVFPTLKASRSAPTLLPWIYDLQHLDQPELFSARERSFRTRAFRRAARSAPILVLSSDAMAAAFAARFSEAGPKIRVLRFTTVPDETWLRGEPGVVRDRYGLPPTFVLLPGQLWVHKDHLTAFEAVRRLRDAARRVCLVCTGGTEDYRDPGHLPRLKAFLETHGLEQDVRVLGVVPRVDYVQLIRAAAVVVQPSRYEGWSSVVEDARALGKRMVLSDIAVHAEQAPAGALYYRVGDPTELAERLVEAQELPPPLDERCALTEQAARVAAYARTFVGIAREAAEAH